MGARPLSAQVRRKSTPGDRASTRTASGFFSCNGPERARTMTKGRRGTRRSARRQFVRGGGHSQLAATELAPRPQTATTMGHSINGGSRRLGLLIYGRSAGHGCSVGQNSPFVCGEERSSRQLRGGSGGGCASGRSTSKPARRPPARFGSCRVGLLNRWRGDRPGNAIPSVSNGRPCRSACQAPHQRLACLRETARCAAGETR